MKQAMWIRITIILICVFNLGIIGSGMSQSIRLSSSFVFPQMHFSAVTKTSIGDFGLTYDTFASYKPFSPLQISVFRRSGIGRKFTLDYGLSFWSTTNAHFSATPEAGLNWERPVFGLSWWFFNLQIRNFFFRNGPSCQLTIIPFDFHIKKIVLGLELAPVVSYTYNLSEFSYSHPKHILNIRLGYDF